MGKIIVIEGTDCSGKETQSKLLKEYLTNNGYKVKTLSYPMYDTPTGKIIAGPLLGKPSVSPTWFTAPMELDPMVASLYYAADRKANLPLLLDTINNNDIIILDRYTYSNMAHQGSKLPNYEDRLNMYNFLENLEFNLLSLPKPDVVFFLYLPYTYGIEMKKNRSELLDESEKNEQHQINSEKTYLELTKLYNFIKINCVLNNKVRTKEDISNEIITKVKKLLK